MITALDHIAVAVPDLAAAIERFAVDFGLAFEHGSLVIFIHPRSCDGVLVELNQPAEPDSD